MAFSAPVETWRDGPPGDDLMGPGNSRRYLATNRSCLLYLAFGFCLTVGYYLVPSQGAGHTVRIVGYCLASASAAVAVLVGVDCFRPAPRLPWLLLAASQLVYLIAGTALFPPYQAAGAAVGATRFPIFFNAFYLARYPLAVAGLVIFIRRRTPGRDLPGLLDAGTLAVAVAMLSWLGLIGPYVRGGSGRLVDAASLIGYPVMDIALLAVGLRLFLGPGRRSPACFLLMGNLFLIMTADTLYGLQQLGGTYRTGNFLDGMWLVANVTLGAAALHPTMTRLTAPAPAGEQNLGGVRLAVLLTAALAAPAMIMIEYARGVTHDIPVMAMACALMFLLTIARMAGLVCDQRRLAMVDSLTGLYTRRFLEAEMSSGLTRVRRGGGLLGLVIIDVDHFKEINDHHGHPGGDRVLAEIGARLRAATRPGDVLARYGGEEFALLASNVDLSELGALAERLRARVAGSPIALDANTLIFATVSVGACAFPTHVSSQGELVAMADGALYSAKARGRDRVVIAEIPRPTAAPAADGARDAGDAQKVRDPQGAVAESW